MLLAIDIGNSTIKFGVFDGEILLSRTSIPISQDMTAGEMAEAIGSDLELPITDAIVCSVVPPLNDRVTTYVSTAFNIEPFFVTNDLDFGLAITYEPLESLGTDRIVNSFAAVEKYGVPCVVCSFGTATTIDVVSENRQFLGGLIAPGFATMAMSLHLNTARLRDVEIERPEHIINSTTASSIQAGIFYAQIGLVESAISKIRDEVGNAIHVIATGGFAWAVSDTLSCIDLTDQNLTLDGLRMLNSRRSR